ncbi:hypothetical protein JYU34_018855 [Plutella xylostella]|uniref:Uncharacterized protein n=1 Tax=Plutella xylostella TaxID=51655 RepID=A0ABQ7PYW0_PLUXY|nr:hypothetical protein JYU34_018855 [Plutella xylostella]
MSRTPRLPRTYSLRILSSLVTPHIHLNIFISAAWTALTCVCVAAQVSLPYIRTGRMMVLYTRPFNLTGILLSQVTPVTSRHFSQAAAILCWMLYSTLPELCIMFPKYLYWSHLMTCWPSMMMGLSSGSGSLHAMYWVLVTLSFRPPFCN